MVNSFAVVVQTHMVTPSLTARLQLARSQLSRGGVALYITLLVGDGPTHRCDHQQALQQLRAAVGPKAVWCLDPPSYEAVWPQFFSSLATLPHRDRYPKRSAIGGFNWAWTMCDLHAFVGALKHRPEYEYLWVLDHDLGWTGDLLDILRQFDTVDADLLTADEATAHRNESGFQQQALRNHLRDDEVRKALLVPARYSRRLLGALSADVAAGRLAFCEARAPSLCAQQRGWCRQQGMRALRPDLFSAKLFGCCIDVSEELLRAKRRDWERSEERSATGRFFHRVREARGLNQSSSVAQGNAAARYMARGMRIE